MKKAFTLFLAAVLLLTANAQPPATTADVLSLKESEFSFGTIPQGKPVYHYFEFTNTGVFPMVVSNVQTSCGCTTPEWSKEPVAPGATAKIKVGYNAAAEGHFEKFITISYNQNLTKQVKISGSVWRAPEGSAPSNASINLLKQKNN
jgi:hypothetical protein